VLPSAGEERGHSPQRRCPAQSTLFLRGARCSDPFPQLQAASAGTARPPLAPALGLLTRRGHLPLLLRLRRRNPAAQVSPPRAQRLALPLGGSAGQAVTAGRAERRLTRSCGLVALLKRGSLSRAGLCCCHPVPGSFPTVSEGHLALSRSGKLPHRLGLLRSRRAASFVSLKNFKQ